MRFPIFSFSPATSRKRQRQRRDHAEIEIALCRNRLGGRIAHAMGAVEGAIGLGAKRVGAQRDVIAGEKARLAGQERNS